MDSVYTVLLFAGCRTLKQTTWLDAMHHAEQYTVSTLVVNIPQQAEANLTATSKTICLM